MVGKTAPSLSFRFQVCGGPCGDLRRAFCIQDREAGGGRDDDSAPLRVRFLADQGEASLARPESSRLHDRTFFVIQKDYLEIKYLLRSDEKISTIEQEMREKETGQL